VRNPNHDLEGVRTHAAAWPGISGWTARYDEAGGEDRDLLA
jgi:hypothetical protein